ncbi:MAG: DNA repair protein RadC [Desulfuromonadales bacterium]|nr:DNA repair protein RadC [Desulfuromonadales bacterium]
MTGGRKQDQLRMPAIQELKLVKIGRVSEKEVRYTNPSMIFDACRDMANLDREHFVVLHLDGKNSIIARETVSIGSLSQAVVHPREVFKAAVHNGSKAIICVHNHPTGDPAPSTDDIAITRRLCEAGGIIGIEVLDHIVIGDGEYMSFVERGYMGNNQASAMSITPSPPYKKELLPANRFLVSIGELVKEFRKRAKMTQKKLVDTTGIHQCYISQIEAGLRKMTEGEAQKISAVFNIDYRKLLLIQTPLEPATSEA